MTTYAEKLKDVRWQKKRLELLEAAGWKCQDCGADTKSLHVHHRTYLPGREPWDYPNKNFVCCCESCHEIRETVARMSRALFQEIDPQVAKAFLTTMLTCGMDLTILAGELMLYVALSKDKAVGP